MSKLLKFFLICIFSFSFQQKVFAVDANQWLKDQMNSNLLDGKGALSSYIRGKNENPSDYEVTDLDYNWNWIMNNYTLNGTLPNPSYLGSNTNSQCINYTANKIFTTLEAETTLSVTTGTSLQTSNEFSTTDFGSLDVKASYGGSSVDVYLSSTVYSSTSEVEKNNTQKEVSQTATCSIDNMKFKSAQTPAYMYLKVTGNQMDFIDAKSQQSSIGYSYEILPQTALFGGDESTTVKIQKNVTVPSIGLVFAGNNCGSRGRIDSQGVTNNQSTTTDDAPKNWSSKRNGFKQRCHNFWVSGNANNSGTLTFSKQGWGGKTMDINFNQSNMSVTDEYGKVIWKSSTGTTSGTSYDVRDIVGDKAFIVRGTLKNNGRGSVEYNTTLDIYNDGNGIFEDMSDMTYLVKGFQTASSVDLDVQCQMSVLSWDVESERDEITTLCSSAVSSLPVGAQVDANPDSIDNIIKGIVTNKLEDSSSIVTGRK